jgi:hypothetical protein
MTARHASMSEELLQENVVKLLNSYGRHDIAWWCCPNGSLRNWKVGVKLKAAGLRKGASDLMFLIDGRFHALELKTEIGVVKSDQHDFAESVTRAGGFFHAAFGLDQAIGVLSAISAFRLGITFTTAAFDGRGVRKRPWESKDTKAATQSPREVRAPV